MVSTTTLDSASSEKTISSHVDWQNGSAASVKQLLDGMKAPLGSLFNSFDALQGQTMQVALFAGESDSMEEFTDLRRRMKEQEEMQKEGIKEIQSILDDLLHNKVAEGMQKQVQEEIMEQIDLIVKEQVAECLFNTHIPQDLQDNVEEDRRELEQIRLALHNSESRRLNAGLRIDRPNQYLNTIVKPNGFVSLLFPKELKDLTTLDADTAKALALEYEIQGVSDSRDANLNRLMLFCGVRGDNGINLA